jgi:prepilin-type N-terminal cleavage/methylation domain-containing protein
MFTATLRPRLAFTLIELLVVIAIVGVLLSLLLPAVQKVREASLRTQCANNLHQIGLAMLAYHDNNSMFPRGGTNDVYPIGSTNPLATVGDPNNRQQWSWAYRILPFLEQEALFNQSVTSVIDQTPVKTFYCPSRRAPIPFGGLAKIDYAGNAGTSHNGTDGVIVRSDYLDFTGTPAIPVTFAPVRIATISDGVSNTLLVGEKQLDPSQLGLTADDNQPYNRPGWSGDYEVYRTAVEQPEQDELREYPGSCTYFGSAHTSTFQTVFCDGSVRTVRYSVDLTVWKRACIRNDGQVFSLGDL